MNIQTKPVIQVRNVKKSFKKVKAVQGIDLEIFEGEYVALLGPNGAGKTTMVEMIEGIQHPDEGEILITGKHWKNHSDELHRLLGISFQETKLIDKLTVKETLVLFASFYGLSAQRAVEIIEIVNLGEKQNAYTVNLSGGQRQRLALGIALLNYPKILLLDEPTTGLDPTARREIWNILVELKNKGETSMILTTHYMEEAEFLCDRIIIIDHGRIIAQGTFDELLALHQKNEIIEFVSKEKMDISEVNNLELGNLEWDERLLKGKLTVNNSLSSLPVFLNFIEKKQINLKSLHTRRMTLDDIFLSLTGRSLGE